MLSVSWSVLAARWLPFVPPPPPPAYEERIYELAWADAGAESPIPEALGLGAYWGEVVDGIRDGMRGPRPVVETVLLAERSLPSAPDRSLRGHVRELGRALRIAATWTPREALTSRMYAIEREGRAERRYGRTLRELDDAETAWILARTHGPTGVEARAEWILARAGRAGTCDEP